MRFITYRGEQSLEDLVKRVFPSSVFEKPELVNAAKDALLDANPQLRQLQNMPAAALLVVPDIPGMDGPRVISQVPLEEVGISHIREGLRGLGELLSQAVRDRQRQNEQYVRLLFEVDQEFSSVLAADAELREQLTREIREPIEQAETTKTEIDNNLKTWTNDIASLLEQLRD